ncbi:MAG: DUF4349 domain-containing protein, partial [Firmicutes bacterium]|nr:DUF4349 domain-containing protein [Bacillota bacterium]
PPPGFSAGVMKKIAAAPRAPKRTGRNAIINKIARGHWSRVLALAATVVLTIGITTSMFGAPGQWGTKNLFFAGEQYNRSDSGDGSGEAIVSSEQPGSFRRKIADIFTGHSGNDAGLGGVNVAGGGPQESPGPVPGGDELSLSSPALQTESGEGPGLKRKEPGQTVIHDRLAEQQSREDRAIQASDIALTGPRNTVAAQQGLVSRQAAFGSILSSKDTRKIIRGAAINLEADNPDDVPARLTDLAVNNGGYLLSKDSGSGSIAMKVPAGRLNDVVNSIQGMGRASVRQTDGEDVSKKYNEVETRLRELAAEEQRLLNASGTSAGLEASPSRLEMVRKELEQQKTLLDSLSNEVDYATINITLDE